MRRTVGMICLTSVLTVAIMMLSEPTCAAPSKHTVQIRLDLTGATPDIDVVTPGNRYVGLCRNWNPAASKHCRGNEISWKLVVMGGILGAGEEVRIWNAPGDHPVCFGTDADPVHTFNQGNQNDPHASGPPADECSQDKYGTYWPYLIEYWKDGFIQASTDPGGIIFP